MTDLELLEQALRDNDYLEHKGLKVANILSDYTLEQIIEDYKEYLNEQGR